MQQLRSLITGGSLYLKKSNPVVERRRIIDMKTEHIQAVTTHARRGVLKNAFRYNVDFILTSQEVRGPLLLSHNRFNLWSVQDRHHGGSRGQGLGAEWFRELLSEKGFPVGNAQLLLLAQPCFLWFQYNPVSFWIALVDGRPRAFVAEVDNTFGHRHCYFCAHKDFREITFNHPVHAEKIMHVSPFQQVAGEYAFNFDLTDERINILISFRNGAEGVIATLAGMRRPASNLSLLKAAVFRPASGLRTLLLIHLQALKLWRKQAPFFPKPPPPERLVSDCSELGKVDP